MYILPLLLDGQMAYDKPMISYDEIRQQYKPTRIKYLLIAESQPPAASVESSRQFYRKEYTKTNDRLFSNTMRALYPDAEALSFGVLEGQKEQWLRRFQNDGWYMIESLEVSLAHEVTKSERQTLIAKNLPNLLTRVSKLATSDTRIILIKSNVFEVAAQPLLEAGFTVLNTELLDYPGRFNQRAYREKLRAMATH